MADILTGLLLHLAFENNANDSSGNGRNFTANNGANYAAGLIGQAGQLSGAGSQNFSCASNVGLASLAAFSWAGHLFIDDLDDFDMMWSIRNSDNNRFEVYQGGTGTGSQQSVAFTVANGGTAKVGYTGAVLTTGTWVHVAVAIDLGAGTDATKGKIYINGVDTALTFSGSWPATLPDLSAIASYVGARGGGSLNYDGLQDEVRLYSRALAPGDVRALAGLYSPGTGLVPGGPGLRYFVDGALAR